MAGKSNIVKNVIRAEDGTLLATSFNLNVCESCSSAHVDLMDDRGTVFATAMIDPEGFREIAAWFIGAAVDFEAKAGRKLD